MEEMPQGMMPFREGGDSAPPVYGSVLQLPGGKLLSVGVYQTASQALMARHIACFWLHELKDACPEARRAVHQFRGAGDLAEVRMPTGCMEGAAGLTAVSGINGGV